MSEKKDIKDKDKVKKEFEVTELDEKELEGAAGGIEDIGVENNVVQCGCNVVQGCSC